MFTKWFLLIFLHKIYFFRQEIKNKCCHKILPCVLKYECFPCVFSTELLQRTKCNFVSTHVSDLLIHSLVMPNEGNIICIIIITNDNLVLLLSVSVTMMNYQITLSQKHHHQWKEVLVHLNGYVRYIQGRCI